ncbi:MAG: CmpA/NrtA family ABC transporter substrate-binding protein [Pseudomonadota bacterium]
MSAQRLNIGFVPLVDCAPLIVAKELQFAADEGLDLNLLRQPSWAALRDLLALGHLEAAHMLAPLPIAMSLGLSGVPVDVDVLMNISANGTVIGVSPAIAKKMQKTGWSGHTGTAKDALIALDASTETFKVGVPFPFSMHKLLFEYWMRNTGLAAKAQIVTQQPPLMTDALARGDIDVFCVGEPWGQVAVNTANAELILTGSQIWSFAPEKVLAVRREWGFQNDATVAALMRAVYKACQWLDQPDNRPLAVEILARSEHLNLPYEALDPAISKHLHLNQNSEPMMMENFIHFHRHAATFPWKSQAAWIAEHLLNPSEDDTTKHVKAATECFRTDLYRRHLGSIGVDTPGASFKVEGTMDVETAIASTHGTLILGPDRFFDGQFYEFTP